MPRALSGIAAGAALLGATAALPLAASHQIAASAFLAGTMAALACEDLRSLRLPDRWTLAAAIGGLTATAVEAKLTGRAPLAAIGWALLAALVCGGVLLLLREAFFRLRKSDGLGLGDVKLAAAGGLWLGWDLFPIAVLVAALGAILWISILAGAQRGWDRQRKIPFGAFLAPAIWICWLGGRLAAG